MSPRENFRECMGVIFDLDGTLIQFDHWYFATEAQRVFRSLGYTNFSIDDIYNAGRRNALFDFISDVDREEVRDSFWQLFGKKGCPEPQLIYGAHEALDFCAARGLRIGLVTGRQISEEALRNTISDTGLLRKVEIVSVANPHDPNRYDKSGRFELVCSQLGLPPERTMCIGDSVDDMQAAHDAFLGFPVGVLSGSGSAKALLSAGAVKILGSIRELPLLSIGNNSGQVRIYGSP